MRTLIIGAMLCATPAVAQQPFCAPRDDLAQALNGQHGETVALQARHAGGLIETWVNPETGTCTITMTRPDGVACIVLVCTDAQVPTPQPTGEPL